MNRKSIVILAITSCLFTVGMMAFTRHGSFNPSEIGFYTSIGAGIIWFIGMILGFKWIIKQAAKNNGSQK